MIQADNLQEIHYNYIFTVEVLLSILRLCHHRYYHENRKHFGYSWPRLTVICKDKIDLKTCKCNMRKQIRTIYTPQVYVQYIVY